MLLRRARALALLAAGLLGAATGHASLHYCDRDAEFSPRQQDVLLRFAGLIRRELDASGAAVALIARSGTDLSRFGVRYSHAGIGVRAHPEVPWSVRQLYFACDERRPRIYDQGLGGFLMGTDAPELGYVSVVLLPVPAAAVLEAAARDNRLALALLGSDYRANAYAFSTRYQNCNQWVAELLAAAFGGLAGDGLRQQAQDWLHAQGYAPTAVNVAGWSALGLFMPWLTTLDHPREDWERQVNRVSLPAALEAFVRRLAPQAQRIEFCHRGDQVVVHRGWDDVAAGCRAGAQDTLLSLDD